MARKECDRIVFICPCQLTSYNRRSGGTREMGNTDMSHAKIAILGGSGFIGSELTCGLLKRGAQVRIGDLKASSSFPELWCQCDVRDANKLQEAVEGADAIVNLAAEHRDDVRPLSRYDETNVKGASEVCAAARRAKIDKIIFTSSVAVYGFHGRPVDENGPFSPFNAYGKTKYAAEGIYRTWAEEDASRTLIIVRPTVVFGEGNRGNVYNLLNQIAAGRFFMVGSGNNVKSIAYVGNVVAFLIHTLQLGSGLHIFNYVDGPDLTTKDLIQHINMCLGRSKKLPRIPKPVALFGGHLLDGVASITGRTFPISAIRILKFCESTQFRADRANESGFTPPFSLKEGLRRTIQFEFPTNELGAP